MTPPPGLREEVQALEHSISRFTSTLIPTHQLDATMPEDKHTLIVTHTIAQASLIHLYQRFAQDDPVSYDKCLQAAKNCVAIIKHITDADLNFLDPIIGVSNLFPAARPMFDRHHCLALLDMCCRDINSRTQ